MKCICKNTSKDLIISIKDDNVVFQACNYCIFHGQAMTNKTLSVNFKVVMILVIVVIMIIKQFDQCLRSHVRILIRILSNKSLKQILIVQMQYWFSIQHSKMFINSDTNFRLVSSTHSTSANSPTIKETKKKKKQKPKNNESQPKSEVEKSKQISDSKNSSKQTKYCSLVNEDIRIFEEKIKQYTSEMDDSQKIVLNLPQEWIKKFGIQKKKK
ncbi:unnamed protein product (macronuclear) [Paramecium tetraurelia]|uniref:Uncharacterized protein n=1 Tax=Paramecium tetraurelia TaxID=5888 RepID=A0DHM9_PARTE|nr:uncharacterized protein GSPATT00016933001 [Paramecium tetraurelia]CAK82546.1 unnamed protein product [Paramecium tetraurelia]|eukprot:XP_001449943.1 hypothetical protein (macronuclear) [Paramecium tetraurelia strain d4-2]